MRVGDEIGSARLSDGPPCLLGGPEMVDGRRMHGNLLIATPGMGALPAVLIFGEILELRRPDRSGYGDICAAAAVRSDERFVAHPGLRCS